MFTIVFLVDSCSVLIASMHRVNSWAAAKRTEIRPTWGYHKPKAQFNMDDTRATRATLDAVASQFTC